MSGKRGLGKVATLYERDGKIFGRKPHNSISAKNARLNECMSRKLTGHHGGGRTAQQARFRAARKECAHKGA